MSEAATDAEPGLPAPRETLRFHGHEDAERAMSDALSARAHHAWLLTGPKGVGKATLAYRFARRLLGARASGERPLDAAEDDPVTRRIAALTHPDLFVLKRGLNDRGKPKREIAVDDVRALTSFFALSPAEGGWRVAIIDSVDDLNRNAANALLKTLEEPPDLALLMLVSHAPGGLLPTIKSRCRRLRLDPVEDAKVAAALAAAGVAAEPSLVRAAAGRPGRALALAAAGSEGQQAFLDAVARAPRDGGAALRALAFARDGDPDARLSAFLEAAQDWCRRAALKGVGLATSEEARAGDALDKQAAGRGEDWAKAFAALGALRAEVEALPLDPAHAYARAAAILAETARGA